METGTLQEVIQKAKKEKFADPVNRKSGKISVAYFVVDDNFDVNGVVNYTTGINLDKNLKNTHLQKMFVISCGASTEDDVFKKKYLR